MSNMFMSIIYRLLSSIKLYFDIEALSYLTFFNLPRPATAATTTTTTATA